MVKRIVEATVKALKAVNQRRFFETERGYEGQFLHAIQRELNKLGILDDGWIVEQEYQKTRPNHDTTQRPDIIIHIPREQPGGSAKENNLAVYALKHKATKRQAIKDFKKLDNMFCKLNYRLGIFVNINSAVHYLQEYDGVYGQQIHAFAVRLVGSRSSITHAYRSLDGAIVEEDT